MLDHFHLEKNTFSDNLLEVKSQFRKVRNETASICLQVEVEDLVVQPFPEVSPAKWHLGHTTWFFEEFILSKFKKNYQYFNEKYLKIFNSYYKQIGDHWEQGERGFLSRPTVAEVMEYRSFVDSEICNLNIEQSTKDQIYFLLNAGIQHEQQHQELLYMDLKSVLAKNVLDVSFSQESVASSESSEKTWSKFPSGLYDIGYDGADFCYDNELPKHQHYLQPFEISDSLVTNGEFLRFIEDGGYNKVELWLSKGWEWVTEKCISNPLYWKKQDGVWSEYTLYGWKPLDPNSPVVHISYYEADAFSKWSGARLPTEQEFEISQRTNDNDKNRVQQKKLHPYDSNQIQGQVWCWTQSHYSPYPGFKSYDGRLAEYNGKFMCGQFVLKGGCAVTPAGHSRYSYRNFYEPYQRWMFSGLRLAKEL